MKCLSFDQGFAIVATFAVICGLGAGFWVLGPPGRQRLIRSDQQRLQDLRSTAERLYRQAQEEENYKLPKTLTANDLENDPLTNQAYEYERLTQTTYQLCAEFATDSSTYPFQSQPQNQDAWSHPQGRHCFEFNIAEQPPNLY